MKKLLYILLFITSLSCYGQATLVKDINLGNDSSYPKEKFNFNGEVYFSANDGVNGYELWKTDGTEAGTVLFKEFATGIDNGLPTPFQGFVNNSMLYFMAWDGTSFNALWKTDGTNAGTVKVKSFSSESFPNFRVTILNSDLIFSVKEGSNYSLWKTDGTTAGTILLKSINPGYLTALGNEVFFSGNGGDGNGAELWKTDGTPTGTVIAHDIFSGTGSSNPSDFNIINNNTIIFKANDGVNGYELWKTDGTTTSIVKNISTGNETTWIKYMEVLNDEVFFDRNVGGTYSLWKTDGTDSGTIEIKNDVGSYVADIVAFNNQISVFSYYNSSSVFWTSDGTVSGTTLITPNNFIGYWNNGDHKVIGNHLYFQGQGLNPSTGYELWKTDGTLNGTVLVKDIHPLFDDDNIKHIIDFNGQVIFTAVDGNWHGHELWISDGTEAGTSMIKDINLEGNRSSNVNNFAHYNAHTFFSADNGINGVELWKTDGTTTTLVKDINDDVFYSYPHGFTELSGMLYFIAETRNEGVELWKTDGTTAGTSIVKDINLNEDNGLKSTGNIVVYNSKLYFFADDGTNGFEFWESDGTSAGTIMVKDINPTTDESQLTGEILVYNNELFFSANDGANGFELWKSDGTNGGTTIVKDINTSGNSNSKNLIAHAYQNAIYFSAFNGTETNLWKSDGTDSGTFKIGITTNPGGFVISGFEEITDRDGTYTVYDTELYFTANHPSSGIELYYVSTLGGVASTDINNGAASSYPKGLVSYNAKLYSAANDGSVGDELWESRGFDGGSLVKDIAPTANQGSNITEIVSFGGQMIFGAKDNLYNKELWKSDGTETGTLLLQEINPTTTPATYGSNPKNFFVHNTDLYFSADDGTNGAELWVLNESVLSIDEENLNTSDKVAMYPNPTSGMITLKVKNQEIQSVKVYSILGREVKTITAIHNNSIENIDIQNLVTGMYLLQIKTSADTFTKKIIKR